MVSNKISGDGASTRRTHIRLIRASPEVYDTVAPFFVLMNNYLLLGDVSFALRVWTRRFKAVRSSGLRRRFSTFGCFSARQGNKHFGQVTNDPFDDKQQKTFSHHTQCLHMDKTLSKAPLLSTCYKLLRCHFTFSVYLKCAYTSRNQSACAAVNSQVWLCRAQVLSHKIAGIKFHGATHQRRNPN